MLFSIISNEVTFNEKVTKVCNSISNLLQYPKEVSYVRKFLVMPDFSIEDIPKSIEVQTFKETITFLNEPVTEINKIEPGLNHISYVKLRQSKRGNKISSYILRVLSDKPDERLELRRTLNKDDYVRRKKVLGDNTRKDLRKHVSVFIFDNSIYHLEKIKTNGKSISILRVMSSSQGDAEAIVPSFIPVQYEVTSMIY